MCYLQWKRTSGEKKKTPNTEFKEKSNTTKFKNEAQACADREKEKWNKGSGVLRMRLYSADPYEKNRAKEWSVPKKQQVKAYANVIQAGPSSIPRWQPNTALQPGGSDFRVLLKNTGMKEVWNLPPLLR